MTLLGQVPVYGTDKWDATPTSVTRIRVIPSAPPTFSLAGSETLPLVDIALYSVQALYETRQGNTYDTQFILDLDIVVKAMLGVGESSALTLDFPGSPKISVLSVENLLFPGIDIDPALLEFIINLVAPAMMTPIEQSLSIIQIPTIYSGQLQPQVVEPYGGTGQHMHMRAGVLIP